MRICCVHQGHELYGSDRSFVETVQALRNAYPKATIEVVLPATGPIVAPLRATGAAIVIEPLWILRRRNLLRLATLGVATFPFAVWRAARRFRASDLVYINTSVVADYIVAARWFPGRAILHVHEIAEGPVRRVLRFLAQWSRARVIFNSQATRQAFAPGAKLKTTVVYNGIAGPAAPEPLSFFGTRPLRLLMLGRISRIKGQEVLLEALMRLPAEVRDRLEVKIVGNAYKDEGREAALARLVQDSGLAGRVTLLPFQADPAPLYRWADVVVVPSRLPESLGRVAIEAMAYGRPALVSGIGGLREVVEDGVTGWVVPPARADLLADKLRAIVEHPADWAAYPGEARARYERLFTEAAAARAIAATVDEMLGTARAPGESARGARVITP
jgi:glycosyltransferase involved in cell wall biosynthesis